MDEKYIPTPEAARKFGLTREYAAKLAKESHLAGNPFPVKRGRSWQAPLEEWAKILHPSDKKIRKPRKLHCKPSKNENNMQIEMYTSAEAARVFGISTSWSSRLARRAAKKGYQWPRWENGQWLAPLDRWEKIFSDPSLRAWIRKK